VTLLPAPTRRVCASCAALVAAIGLQLPDYCVLLAFLPACLRFACVPRSMPAWSAIVMPPLCRASVAALLCCRPCYLCTHVPRGCCRAECVAQRAVVAPFVGQSCWPHQGQQAPCSRRTPLPHAIGFWFLVRCLLGFPQLLDLFAH